MGKLALCKHANTHTCTQTHSLTLCHTHTHYTLFTLHYKIYTYDPICTQTQRERADSNESMTDLVGQGEKKHVGHELEPSDGAKLLSIDLRRRQRDSIHSSSCCHTNNGPPNKHIHLQYSIWCTVLFGQASSFTPVMIGTHTHTHTHIHTHTHTHTHTHIHTGYSNRVHEESRYTVMKALEKLQTSIH